MRAAASVFLVCVAVGCSGAPGDVTGRVVHGDGEPAQGAVVEIAGVTGETDADGRFSLSQVPGGVHELTATESLSGAAFVSASVSTEVDGDVELDTLTLPEPITVKQDSATSSAITVSWSAFADGAGFREYRLYRGNSTALDQESGELLHVTTDVDELSYEDVGGPDGIGLPSNTSFFYRVYVLDEYGGLAGSNVLEAATSQWDVEDFDVVYSLEPSEQFTAEAAVKGLAWGDGCLWVGTEEEVGGYYDENLVVLSCRDLTTGETPIRHELNDEFIHLSGLAFGESLWANYTSTGSGSRKLKRLDPETAEELGAFGMPNGVADIDFDGTHLLLNNQWNYLELMTPATGTVTDSFDTVFDHSTARGVAVRDGEIWLSSQASDALAVLDESGDHIGYATLDILESGWNYADGLQMAFLEDGRLAFAKDARVYLYEVHLESD